VPFSTFPSGPIPTLDAMPDWIVLLALAIAAWLVVSVGGGLLLGRLLGFVERHRPHPRRRTA